VSRAIVTGALVTDFLPVFGPDGFTPHTGAVCTPLLWKNGVADATPVTVAEVGVTGWYKVTFTPATAGFWYLDVTNDHNTDRWRGEYDVATAAGGATTPMKYDTDLEVPRSTIYVNILCTGKFPIYNIATDTPKTGLAAGVTYQLWKDGAVYAGFVVTVAEIGVSGHYSYSFTPIATGAYVIEFANGENSQLVRVEYQVVAPVLIGVSP
jgi:hypothetical protein